jgi:hypothetical protein
VSIKYFHKGHEARRVDAQDYDAMCELIVWCAGWPVTSPDGEHVIEMTTPGGDVMVKAGEWVIKDAAGNFHVHRDPEWRPVPDPWPYFLSQPDPDSPPRP